MDVIKSINNIIWSPALVALLVAAGVYFTIGTRCVQVRKIGTMLRILNRENRRKKVIRYLLLMRFVCLSQDV